MIHSQILETQSTLAILIMSVHLTRYIMSGFDGQSMQNVDTNLLPFLILQILDFHNRKALLEHIPPVLNSYTSTIRLSSKQEVEQMIQLLMVHLSPDGVGNNTGAMIFHLL